jgi:hypothetical protein
MAGSQNRRGKPKAPRTAYKPGQSGNPGGRPKGLARYTRELLGNDGKALAQFWAQVLADKEQPMGARLEASKLLAERGWGKAAAFEAIEGDPLGLEEDVDRAIAEIMDELEQKRQAKAAGKPAGGVVEEKGEAGTG